MGTLTLGIAMAGICRRLLPVTSFCAAIDVRTAIVLGFLVLVSLAMEMAPTDFYAFFVGFVSVGAAVVLAVSWLAAMLDVDSANPTPLIAPLAPRAPPLS